MSPAKPSLLPLLLIVAGLASLGSACGESAGSEVAGASDAPTEAPPTGGGLIILASPNEDVGPELGGLPERPYYHSFGKVLEGETVQHKFRIENTDPRPVTIAKIVPGCGCTVSTVRYTDAAGETVVGKSKPGPGESVITIPAGVVFEIQVQIDTHDVTQKNADKTSTIVVTTDSEATRYLKLEAHIFVERPFDQLPNGIHFGRVSINGGGSGSVQIVQAPGYDYEITGIASISDGVDAEVTPEHVFGSRIWRLNARLHPPLELGVWSGEAILSTENGIGEPGPPVHVGLQADCVPDLIAHPTRLVFTASDAEAFGQFELTSLLPGHAYHVTEAEFADAAHADLLDVSFTPEDPTPSGAASVWIIEVRSTSPDAITEMVRGELVLKTDDPQHPEFRATYVVHARAAR